VQVLEKKYGPVHPVVVRTQRSIALVHKKQGKYDAAKRLYEQLLAAIAAVFGNAHYLYGVVLGELADVMRKVRGEDRAIGSGG
jgi:tetratricopeptide (TPR) repeat protein